MTETRPPVPEKMTLEYLVEVFSNHYTKEQVEGFVEVVGLEGCRNLAAGHAELRYNGIEFSEEDNYPETLEYCVEELSDKHNKEQVEAWVEEFGVKKIAQIASGHAQVKEGVKNKDPYFEDLYEMDLTPKSDLEEQFGCAFTHEEAEAVVAGFNGDVGRASRLYRELTEGYVSFMTVEALIEAGKF